MPSILEGNSGRLSFTGRRDSVSHSIVVVTGDLHVSTGWCAPPGSPGAFAYRGIMIVFDCWSLTAEINYVASCEAWQGSVFTSERIGRDVDRPVKTQSPCMKTNEPPHKSKTTSVHMRVTVRVCACDVSVKVSWSNGRSDLDIQCRYWNIYLRNALSDWKRKYPVSTNHIPTICR